MDWLRVLAFSLLILYHAGMPYVEWGWHIKNVEHWPALQEAMRFVNRWRMPLIFLIAGATIMISLGRRQPGAFVLDRLKRLLLPLGFGMLVVVPPQLYFERRQQGQFAGSFLEFLPHAFDGGAYPAGNISWHHLWFLAYVLVLTLVLLPLLLWMRSQVGRATLDRWSSFAVRWHLVPLMALPLFASQYWLQPVSENRNGLWGDWHGLVYYGTLLLMGALLYCSRDLMAWLERARFAALATGIVCFAVLEISFFSAGPVRSAGDGWLAYSGLSAVNVMAWLVAIAGFARRHARPARFLQWASPAVYPFYILHQTVAVTAAFYLVQLGWSAPAKYVATAILTFAGTWLVYALLVRRLEVLRLLFGMAPKSAAAPKARLEAA
ncbi:MAG: acyltransferase family protein [Reyranellaceae bacterium]